MIGLLDLRYCIELETHSGPRFETWTKLQANIDIYRRYKDVANGSELDSLDLYHRCPTLARSAIAFDSWDNAAQS